MVVDRLCFSTFKEVSELVFTVLSNYDNGIIFIWKEARILEEGFFMILWLFLEEKKSQRQKMILRVKNLYILLLKSLAL